MSVFHPHDVHCPNGHTFSAPVASSVNGHRSPALRRKILDGELHRAECDTCRAVMTIEKSFYYTDGQHNCVFQVHPRGDRHRWRTAGGVLNAAVTVFPTSLLARDKRALRVVFGMDELREKLVAQDHHLDDRDVELLKVILIHEHPVLLARSRLRLTLD